MTVRFKGHMRATSLYDKMSSYNFNIVRFPHKTTLYHQKCFLQPLVQKYFESVERLPLWYSLLKHLKFFYIEYWSKGQMLYVLKRHYLKWLTVMHSNLKNTILRSEIQIQRANSATFNITCWCCFFIVCMYIYNLYVICVDVYVCQF